MGEADIKIPAELFALAESSRFEGEYALDVLRAGPDDYRFDSPLSWSVDVTNTGSALLVAGTVTHDNAAEKTEAMNTAMNSSAVS